MIDRRDFLTGCAVATGLLAAPELFSAPRQGELVNYHRIVTDGRYCPSVEFAAAALVLGGRVADLQGDATHFWTRDLHGQWLEDPRPVAGLTTQSTLFAIETMSRGTPARVILRVHHDTVGDHAGHHVFGPRECLGMERDLLGAGHQWAAAAAAAIMHFPANNLVHQRERSSVAQGLSHSQDPSALVTWIMAKPIDRAVISA